METFFGELEKIQGWPIAAIVVAVCIVAGYILKFIKPFPNNAIPVFVILFGSLLYLLLSERGPTSVPLRIWITKNIATGIILGFIAWMVHGFVLSRIEDWLASKFQFMDKLLNKTTDKAPPGNSGIMPMLLIIASLALVATGCSSISGTRTLPDGTQLTVRSMRFFWASEMISAGTEDTNGFKFTLTVGKSKSDADAIGAVARGVAEGLAKGVSPIP